MHRTARRPLARHTVAPRNALVFGLVLGVLATALLALTTNLLAAALGVVAIGFYVVVYTMLLKRRTSQNIVWGGAAGCMPVLIGWAAVTGSLSWVPWVLFAVIFFWTPPHYWPLAMRYRDDYAAPACRCCPSSPPRGSSRSGSSPTPGRWSRPPAAGGRPVGGLYAVAAVLLGAAFLREAHRLHARTTAGAEVSPMRLFHWSITYLALLFLAVAVDQLV